MKQRLNFPVWLVLSPLAVLAAAGCSPPPVQVALFRPLQVLSERSDVRGVRLALVESANRDVTGIDLGGLGLQCEKLTGLQATGAASVSRQAVCGLQASGLASVCEGEVTGLQASGIVTSCRGDMAGVQFGGFISGCNNMTGIQLSGLAGDYVGHASGIQLAGLFNTYAEATGLSPTDAGHGPPSEPAGGTTGAQVALVANACQRLRGIQIGAVNGCDGHVCGLQFGLFNRTADLTGVQIGLVNRIPGQWLPFIPFLNLSF